METIDTIFVFIVGKLLENGCQEGLVRKDIPVNLSLEILLGACQAIMNPQKMEELGLTLKYASLSIIWIVLEGAITRKGRKIL
jgi:hypothetical protein